MRTRLLASSLLAVVTSSVFGADAVTFEFLDPFTPDGLAPTDVSADGSVIVGNVASDGSFETFRWTEEGGVERLGRATVPVIGVGGGSPDVSEDGTRVSATIIDETFTLATIGVWTEGLGWSSAEYPDAFPTDAGDGDQSIGSAWGLSGDGETVVGLYWRYGAVDGGLAHACAGSPDAIGDLGGLNDRSSRADVASFDGSVVGGWTTAPTGARQPTLWIDDEIVQLDQSDVGGQVGAVTADGLSCAGTTWSSELFVRAAYRWDLDEKSGEWQQTLIGAIPGTAQPNGLVSVNGMSETGIVVGYNQFSIGNATAFISFEPGVVLDSRDWLADNGVVLPEEFLVWSFTGITPDGKTIIGFGFDGSGGGLAYRAFRITIESDECTGDIDGDGTVGGSDLAVVLGAWGTADAVADLDGNGNVDGADLAVLLGAWGPCSG